MADSLCSWWALGDVSVDMGPLASTWGRGVGVETAARARCRDRGGHAVTERSARAPVRIRVYPMIRTCTARGVGGVKTAGRGRDSSLERPDPGREGEWWCSSVAPFDD
eukprot:COSAG03_NODE_376_length_8389_cov_5.712666_2_plen_108_part_00